ncbi:plasmodesmata-located protein 2-like [Juglans microcarpa x Juglans regia]|uniref:plasmodesmata-located protein 2-like n=1 Tax=Juglans microcarpa x Juglans regia TaxID=2249226 RepID=UPI001B7F6D28|nr:plasmodesmata-located protein 2-like [Juglans microcarpa x Juglans regia]
MDSSLISFSLPSNSLLLILHLALFLPSVRPFSDYSTLVYKNCESQTSTDPTKSYTETLSALFHELLAHSSQSKFFKAVELYNEMAISGLFQCRGDISDEECYDCVNALSQISNSLCSQSMAARVQLLGCYTHYEADGFHQTSTSKTNLLFKNCGKSDHGVAVNFAEIRDAAFAAMESGVVSGNGFYTSSYDKVQVMAQCEGDLGDCDCGECVSNAVQIAQEECGSSVAGEIYFDKCFMTYSYSLDGLPGTEWERKQQ